MAEKTQTKENAPAAAGTNGNSTPVPRSVPFALLQPDCRRRLEETAAQLGKALPELCAELLNAVAEDVVPVLRAAHERKLRMFDEMLAKRPA